MSDENQKFDRTALNRMLIAMFAMVALMFAVSLYAWFTLPSDIRIPVHWGINGEPNRFASKAAGLMMMPGTMLFIVGVLAVIPIIEPRRQNLLRSFVAYRMIGLSLMAFLLLLHLATIANLEGYIKLKMTSVTGLLMSALIMMMGNYLGKVRSNFMFGIRTPWTLSSNVAWDRTHRLGGRLFFLTGLAGVILSVTLPHLGMKICIALLLACSAYLVFYSWFVWRTAPDRQVR